jgi:hypothetical protein
MEPKRVVPPEDSTWESESRSSARAASDSRAPVREGYRCAARLHVKTVEAAKEKVE